MRFNRNQRQVTRDFSVNRGFCHAKARGLLCCLFEESLCALLPPSEFIATKPLARVVIANKGRSKFYNLAWSVHQYI